VGIYLVTGINGFIGSHVSQRLLSRGLTVRGIVRRTSDLTFLQGQGPELSFGDITDRESLAAPMKGVEVVIHVAGLASDWGPLEKFYEVNVTGTRNTAEEANRAGVRRFVHIGTTAVHGFPGYSHITESAPMAETSFPYCETKKMAENWLFDFARTVRMEISSIRPGNVFGPRDHTFIEKYLDALVDGKLGYVSGGCCLTAPNYIDNLVDAIETASVEPRAAGEAFFITDGLDITWNAFTEKFAASLGVPAPKLSVPFAIAYALAYGSEKLYHLLGSSSPPMLTRYRISNGGRDYHFSIDKARNLLAYNPAVNFEDAVENTVRWYRNR
jgi:nucleoside-diphosphate-sugar epimerase